MTERVYHEVLIESELDSQILVVVLERVRCHRKDSLSDAQF